MPVPSVIACQECDLLQRETILPPGGAARCKRCGAVLYRNTPGSLDRTLALTVGAIMLFVLANAFPIVEIEVQGDRHATTLYGAVRALWDQEMEAIAALVFFTTMLMPAVELAIVAYILLPLRLGRVPHGMAPLLRLLQTVRPWGMIEVFMLGVLVSLVRLAHLASVVPGIALWSFGGLILLLAAASSFNARDVWVRVSVPG
jgi:paraquat-inducible protein A